MLDTDAHLVATHPHQTIIGDKHYYGRLYEQDLTDRALQLLRPARKGEGERVGAHSPPRSGTTTTPTSPSNDP